MKEWYGLVADGELIAIQAFNHIPTIFDFHMGYCSWIDYEIVEVDPIVTKILEPVE
jgi:hypothetical protein